MEAGACEVLRLGTELPWKKRQQTAGGFLRKFSPQCISVQFVCYGFHPRGFVNRVTAHLRKVLGDWPVQIMFHELWIGEECGASWKDRAIGWVQRRGVLRLLRSLNVQAVHTSNPAYVHLLAQRGVCARELPLFGPLPLPSPAPSRTGNGLTFVFFGTLHPIWPAEPLFTYLRGLGVPVTLVHVGRIGSGEALWNRLEQEYGNAFIFRRLGELPPETIAEVFAGADFGIATTPWVIIGKSASVAAMLDAGLPVIVNRDDVRFRGFSAHAPAHPLLIRMSSDLPSQLRAAHRQPARLRLPEVAAQFLDDLDAARIPQRRS